MARASVAIAAVLALATPAAAQRARTPPIALSCAGCHGANGTGQGSIPAIAGYDRPTFLQTWAAFRANERPATIMNRIARGYTDAEVAQLAEYFATLR
jgi:sulfide dehydrogenase cytochrome subunit